MPQNQTQLGDAVVLVFGILGIKAHKGQDISVELKSSNNYAIVLLQYKTIGGIG